jgi:long-subunit fatty acid transport protein
MSQNPIIYDISEDQELSNYYDGEISELNFAFSGVYQEKLHVGAGLNFYDISFSQQTVLRETNNDGNDNTLNSRFYQENYTNGVGFSLSTGFIYKPTNTFRFGISYKSPTWFTEIIENTNIINNDGFFGDTEIEVSNSDVIYNNNFGGNLPIQELLYKLRTPSKITASTAIIFGKFGLISFDYSTNNYKGLYLSGDNFSQENLFFDNQLKRADAIRLGSEWRINNLSVRGGYVYEQSPFINSISSDNLESYSLGLGYNFGTVKLNLSYKKSNKTDQYDFYPQYNEVEATQLNINNTIITIGFSVNI